MGITMHSTTINCLVVSMSSLLLAWSILQVNAQDNVISLTPDIINAATENNHEGNDCIRTMRKMLGGLMTVGQEAMNRMGSNP